MAAPTAGIRHGDQGQALVTITGQPFAAFIVQIHKWEFEWPNDYESADVFGEATPTSGHKFYRAMYNVTGTLEGYCDARAFGSAHDPGTAATAELALVERRSTAAAQGGSFTAPGAAVYYKGNAHLNIKMGVNRERGLNSFVATFRGDGDWTETVTT